MAKIQIFSCFYKLNKDSAENKFFVLNVCYLATVDRIDNNPKNLNL
jgi:hypothetical protein